MMTFDPSLRHDFLPMELPSIALSAASPARTSVLRESAPEYPKEPEADYGLNTTDLLASYDQDSSVWRTSQTSLLALLNSREHGLAAFSETWPRSGMMRNGRAYRRRPSVPYMLETVFGSSHIPTPTACDYKGSGVPRLERGPKNNLRDWFKWHFNLQYPPVAVVEYMMGFPEGHTALKLSETL